MSKKRNTTANASASPPSVIRGWRIAFLVACTVGICLSADLIRLHYNVHTDPNYHSYCAISERVNCDTLALSAYAVFANLPLAVWGLLGYLLMAALAVWGLGRKPQPPSWPFGMAFWLSAFSSVLGVVLFFIAHLVVRSVCIVCAGTYLVSFSLVLFAFFALRGVGYGPVGALADELRSVLAGRRTFFLFAVLSLVVLITVWAAMPPYWRVEVTAGPEGLPVGNTEDGHPWIGSNLPALEIIEYSDYECPHCLRGHHELRELVEAYPDKIRLIHRHFPLDMACNEGLSRPFHEHACAYARMAYCAQQRGRFWEANDYLFEHGRRTKPITIAELAGALRLSGQALEECVASNSARQAILDDLASGRAQGIRGTPSFVVDGEVYPGRIPPDVLLRSLGLAEQSAAPP
jgi:protein-disulfide isomerase/uncharacterized membrane protein